MIVLVMSSRRCSIHTRRSLTQLCNQNNDMENIDLFLLLVRILR